MPKRIDSQLEQDICKLLGLGFTQRRVAEELLGSITKRSTVADVAKRNRFVQTSERQPKVLILDIETSSAIVGAFSRWNINIAQSQVFQEVMMLGLVAKWFGSNEYIEIYPSDFSRWSTDEEQRSILNRIWLLLDQADFVIAHNGDKFDVPLLNAQFVKHGFSRPSPYKRIDTLKIAKKYFKFPSNALDSLGEFLGLGRKKSHSGYELWRECMSGNVDKFREMIDYNVQDVKLLEDVYMTLRSWDSSHPNLAFHCDDQTGSRCGVCGSNNLDDTGKFAYTGVSQFPLYKCNDCNSWHRGRKSVGRNNEILVGVQ